MAKIELPKPVSEALAKALSTYLKSELELEVAGFDALFLLEFILERVGPHIYNQALYDTQAHLHGKLEALGDAVLEIEKPAKL